MFWWIISALVIISLVVFKFREVRHKVVYGAVTFFVIFFVVTLIYVCVSTHVNITTYDGFVTLGKVYTNWVVGAFDNVWHTTVYAVKQNWGINASGANFTSTGGSYFNFSIR